MWENDVFAKGSRVEIHFADKSVYTGFVTNKMEYTDDQHNGAETTYQFHDGATISYSVFVKNVPTLGGNGNCLVFTDGKGKIWDREIVREFLVIRQPNRFNCSGDGGGGDV